MQRRPAIITSVTAIVVGCAAAVAVPLLYSAHSHNHTASVKTFGAGAPTRLAAERPRPPASPSPGPTPLTTVTQSTAATKPSVKPPPTSTSTSSREPTPRPAPSSPSGGSGGGPTSLTISGTAISAPIVAVGVDADGSTEIPARVDTVGWYRFGPQPGASAGSVVLVGHVDSAQQGEGAFFRLGTVRAGAVVSVTSANGHVYRYRVVGRQEYPKTSVPLAALFTRTGAPHLTLITCGGSFDAKVRHYRDNVVVTAVPIT